MELEKDKWYWVSSVEDGDIFYPVLGAADGYVMLDGRHYKVEKIEGLRIELAVMPDAQ